MAAQVRVGKIAAAVTPPSAAQVRIGKVTASVTAATGGGPRVRVGRITASVVTTPTAAPASRVWRNGAWVTPGTRQVWLNGALRTPAQRQVWLNGSWHTPTGPAPTPTPVPAVPGYTLVIADEFATIDPTRWYVRDNDTYGADGGRIQRYMARNAVISAASDGNGLSLKLIAKREVVGGNPFTAAMLDTETANWYAPRYHRKLLRAGIMHGQGVWQAWWSTAFNGGAGMVELDDLEIFHAQQPGKTEITLHRKNNAGVYQGSIAKAGKFVEAPTATPGAFHDYLTEVYPVTDATGATAGDPNQPSSYVRLKGYVDGVKFFDYVDTEALYWTTNGGDPADPVNRFWNIFLQGSQIDGKWVGHPDDPFGYSHLLPGCISGGGTAPNACNTSVGGQPIIRAQFPNTFEIASHTVWRFTG